MFSSAVDPLGTANFTNTTSSLFRSRTPSETISPSCPCMLTMRSPTAWQNGQPFSVNDSTGLFPLSGYADDLLVTGQFDFLEAFARPDAATGANLTDRFETTSPLPSCKSVPNLFEKSATIGRQGLPQERHTISKGSSVVPTERKSKSRRIGLSTLFHSSRKRSSSKRRKISALESKTGEEKVEPPLSPGVGVGINGSNIDDRRRSFTRHSSLGSLHLSTSVPTRSRKSSRPPKFFAKYLTPTRKKSISAASGGGGGGGSSNNNHKDSNTGVVDAPTSSRRKKKSSMNTDEESLLSCTSRTRSFDESGSPVAPSATGHSDYCTNQADSHVSSSTGAASSSRSLPRPPWYSPGVVGLRQLLTFPPVQLLQPVVERCRNVFGSSDRISRPSSRVRSSVLSRGDNTMSRSLDAIFSASASSEDRSQTLPSVGGTNDTAACGQPPIDAALWSAFRVVSIVPLLLGLSSAAATAAQQDTKTSPPSSRPTLLEMAANAQQASASGSAANTPDSQSLRVLLRHAPKTSTNNSNSAAPAPENRLSSNRVKFSPQYGGAPDPDPSPPVDKRLADFLSPSEDQQKPLTAPTSRGRQLSRHWTPQRELSAPAEGALTAGRRKLSQPAPNHLYYPCNHHHHYHHHQPHHHHPQHHHHRLPLSIHCYYCCSASNDAHTQQYTLGGQHTRDSFHAVPSGHNGCCCCSSCSMHNDSYSPSSAAALLSPSGFVGLRISGRHSSPCPPSTVAGAACSQLAHSDILNGERFTRLDSTSSAGDGIFAVAPSPLAGASIGPSRLTPSSLDADAEHSHTTDYSPCSQVLSADSPQNISWTLAASSRQSSTRSSFSRLSIDNPVAASRDAYLKVTQDGYLNRSAGDGSFDESEVSAPILHGTGVFSPLYSSELVSLHSYLSKGAGASTSMPGGDSMHPEPNHHSFDDYRPPSGDFDALEASFGAGEAAEDTATLYAELQQSDDACANVNPGSYEPVFPQNPFNYYNLRVTTGDQEEPQCNDRAEPFEERKVSADVTTTDESPSLAESETASPDPPPVVQPQSTPCRRRLAFRSVDRRPPIILRNRILTDTDDALDSVFQDETPLSSQCASVNAVASDADLNESNLRTETRTSF
nr:unnamed protein product [Spirometra erinaceieuropaei]